MLLWLSVLIGLALMIASWAQARKTREKVGLDPAALPYGVTEMVAGTDKVVIIKSKVEASHGERR